MFDGIGIERIEHCKVIFKLHALSGHMHKLDHG
jgi:hypothetical protein